MQDLLTYIVSNLVSKPDEVKVEETHDAEALTLNLSVSPDDMGMVIGKSGQTIKAIRRLMIAKANGENLREKIFVNLRDVEVAA